MIVYIDFDRTLFNCENFLKDFYAIINKYKIPKTIFMKCQNQCKKMGFNPHIILDRVSKYHQFNTNIYSEIDNLIHSSKKYLYADSIDFLKYLKKMSYQIIILTKGNTDYQKEKILSSGIEKYYDELMITMKHKGNLDIHYKDGIFIDDNPIEIKSILRRKPKKVIRIRRENSKFINEKLENIEIVDSLEEIAKKNIL